MSPSIPVLTPFGWKPLGELRPGSAICATDGTVTQVIGVYPRGKQQLYKLTWHDGSTTVCDEDHIWLGWLSNKSRKIGGVRTSGEASAKKWLTKQIVEYYGRENSILRRFAIPVISAPTAFTVAGTNKGPHEHITREVPPYILGVLLGDGCLTSDSTRFCSADQEIPDRVEHLLLESFGPEAALSVYTPDSRCPSYNIPTRYFRRNLEQLGLMGCRAETKFIPRIYLFASVEERWELLRGLMDTDGWAEADGDCYFGSSSKQLSEDVRHLARSLGAVVTWREKAPTYEYKGEKLDGMPAYTLRIKIPEADRMFHLERKAALCRGRTPQSMALWLESIERAGEAETICIQVAHPNSLYIVENFVVTHNTDGMLGDWLSHSAEYGEHATGVFFRRTYKQLSEVIARSTQLFSKIGAIWNGERAEWKMPGGARLLFRHLERDEDAENYQGHNYSRVYIEEATNFPSASPINKLRATIRSTVPGMRVGMRLTGNPGGPGHAWVKRRYIDPAPEGYRILSEEFENPWTKAKISIERVFIPAKLLDNKLLMEGQPMYVAQLQQTGSQQLVEAWLLGKWDMIAGAFFTEFDPDKHVLPASRWLPKVPPHSLMFRAFDWGFARPFSVGWYVVSDGTWGLPAGSLVKIREWYGCTGTPNEGVRLDAHVVARGIKAADRELLDDHGLRLRYGVADPAIFIRDGGPSIAEAMYSHGVIWNRADNKREPGWQQVRHRLNGGMDGRPMLYFLDSCPDTIRTFPVLQHATRATHQEDLDTEGEDHAADETRYAMQSRPWTVFAPGDHEGLNFPKLPSQLTFNDLLSRNRQKRLAESSSLGV